MSNGARGSYARTIYSNVRAALSAAVDDGHLPRNPCAARSVRPPIVDTKRVKPWTPERVFAVRAAVPERFRAMVDLGGGCGLRQGEILGVAVDAIDFESDTLHVVQQLKLSRSKAVFAPPKVGKLRDVPLHAGVIPVPERGQPHAESRENGMHALRHFYASVLLDAGENIKALAEYLGHSDPGLTLRVYAHLMPSSQERTRKAVAAVFGSTKTMRHGG